ncbi:DUF5710 domain-containing protein [[Clostridium] fimetarium]|uniref:DUF5710 domain-containing protein n=1 Tax=[Clostridium] fimetarium TaxID=99656 RepID=A0A1I0MB08_9FIRM|nr:DUF5710 domain-containing protein [[Clostridium] fimetarium]SEV85308.1 hypothetical protein SAMN05421659_101348 [[Clostridium] fimetarium]
MLYLDVPYHEKDEVKSLGAWWDSSKKKWYVKDGKDYFKFSKWILKDYEEAYILCDHFYIIVGSRQCYKCKKQTDVIAFGVEKYCTLIDGKVYDEEQNYEWSDGDIHITSMITPINKELQDYLSQKYNYHLGYSYTVKVSYTANHCSNCKALQGHFFLYEEVDSPFFIDSIESVKALKLYKVRLEHDIVVDADICWGSEDGLIKKYAEIQELLIK